MILGDVSSTGGASDAYRVKLADALRPLRDPVEIQEVAARTLGEHLRVNRVVYCEIESEDVIIGHTYASGVPKMTGRYPLAMWGDEVRAELSSGRTCVVDDVTCSPVFEGDARHHMLAAGIQAVIAVGLVEDGRWLASFGAQSAQPRAWTPAEVDAVVETAERTWDAMQRARAEAKLRETKQHLELALAAGEMGTFVWHVQDDRGELDDQTMRLLGVSSRVVTLGDAIAKFLHPDDQARVAAAVQLALDPRGPRAVHEDLRIALPDGSERWLSIAARMHFAGDAPASLVGTATDITQRKLTEATLRAREEQLRELDRRKDEWIAMLAHELRNPLAPLRTGVDTLRLVPDRPDVVADTTDMMDRQVRHVTRLIDDLLDISRVTRGKIMLRRKAVPLDELVRVALDAHRAAIAARQLAIDLQLEDSLVLDVDADRIVQVLSNVLHNATKFTPPGGRIEILGRRAGDDAVVIVRDTGVGIAADLLPRLFQPFTQGPRASDLGGLGVGLALARELVELHGGQIRAHSDGPGRGTELSIRLPRSQLAAGSGAFQAATARRGRSVVIIDDNQDAARALALLVSALGGSAQVAHTGDQGVARVRELRPDVVLLDLGMTGIDGHETCRRLREEYGSELTIVAVTGWGKPLDRQRTTDVGFDAHLVKPVDITLLRPYITIEPTP